jgi:hypothetical protein
MISSLSRAMALVVSMLALPAALWSQMPPQAGKLIIASDPVGAVVTINGEAVSQHANATFVVSPGKYTVSVASADGSLKCPEITLQVGGGQTITRSCSARGWQ